MNMAPLAEANFLTRNPGALFISTLVNSSLISCLSVGNLGSGLVSNISDEAVLVSFFPISGTRCTAMVDSA